MKKIVGLVFCLVVLLGTPNGASAHTHGIRVFDTESVLPNMTDRVEVWSGCPVMGEIIATDCLAEQAYNIAQTTGAISLVPERNRSEASYKDLFLRWNDLGSTMSVSRFVRKATGTGFYLPQGFGRSTPLSMGEWATIRGELNLLQQQVNTLGLGNVPDLRKQIEGIQNRLGGLDTTTSGMIGTLSTLENMVKNLSALSPSELDAQKAEMDARLSGLTDRITRLENTKADKSAVTSLEARVSSLENPGVSAPFTSAEASDFFAQVKEWLVKYWWIPALLLLLGALAWFVNKRQQSPVTPEVTTVVAPVGVVPSSVSVTADQDRYETLRVQFQDPKTGVLARLGQLEEVVNKENGVLDRMEQLDTAVTQLRTDYDYLLLVSTDGLRMVGTPDQETLEALKIGEHIDLAIEGDEGTRTVRIVRGTFENENSVIEDRLYVYGVTDVNQGVSVDSVRLSRCLLRAIKEWKVVGIDDTKIGLSAAAYKRTPRKLSFRRSSTKAA